MQKIKTIIIILLVCVASVFGEYDKVNDLWGNYKVEHFSSNGLILYDYSLECPSSSEIIIIESQINDLKKVLLLFPQVKQRVKGKGEIYGSPDSKGIRLYNEYDFAKLKIENTFEVVVITGKCGYCWTQKGSIYNRSPVTVRWYIYEKEINNLLEMFNHLSVK